MKLYTYIYYKENPTCTYVRTLLRERIHRSNIFIVNSNKIIKYYGVFFTNFPLGPNTTFLNLIRIIAPYTRMYINESSIEKLT